MNANPNDPLVSLSEAAVRMGVNERRARGILTRSQIQTVRTPVGICYRLDDVEAVRKMNR